jgi:hypothetical protein
MLKKCDVCKHLVNVYIGYSYECPICGWRQSEESREHPDWAGIANIPSLNSARELYKKGKPLIADFSDFVQAWERYGELEFTYKGIRYGVWGDKGMVALHSLATQENIAYFKDAKEFGEKANIKGVLLKDLWHNVTNTDFLQ